MLLQSTPPKKKEHQMYQINVSCYSKVAEVENILCGKHTHTRTSDMHCHEEVVGFILIMYLWLLSVWEMILC